MTLPCRFLTEKRYSVPHQSSQLTEDTEVEEKRGRAGVTQNAKGRSRK